jgi:hypothetical protein
MAPEHRQPVDYITCKHCRKDFRAITFLHLRNIHGYDGDHPINDYKRKFRLQTATCLDSRKKISAAKDYFWARQGRHWTRAKLLDEIRRVHRAGKSLRQLEIPDRLYLAGRRLYGTWRAAVEKAGLDYEKATGIVHWTPEKVVEAIKELAQRGVPLSATYIKTHHQTLLNVARKQFPHGWGKALEAAGFDPAEHKVPRSHWTRQQAEVWVRKREAKGKPILAGAAPGDLLHFVYNRLGTTWTDFVESLGITYPGVKKCRDWTKQKLLAEMRRWNAEGHRLNYRAVADEYQALIHQARKFFGSWDRARAAARV